MITNSTCEAELAEVASYLSLPTVYGVVCYPIKLCHTIRIAVAMAMLAAWD